ncbi:MAG: hypothetical protein FJW35_02375 [Acidobacteria bacterium]|nr:hypothetical protein [Acidobacteriota bacterium]
MLIRSIRRFSGPYSASPVYVAVDGGEKLPCAELAAAGAILLPLEMEEPARNCPFAHKVFASAQVERRIAASADTMVWLDAETLILAPPRALDLRAGCAVAMRPVFLVNNVGIPPDRPPDIFSSGIYA